MRDNLLPADVYTVLNQTILTELDKKTLISLYEPIIGPIAVSLFLTLWSDLDKYELISIDYTHHHLMTILKSSLDDIKTARKSLEAVGLIKTFINRNENINSYVYELYSPLNPYEFFNHPILSILLLNNIGDLEYKAVKTYYKKTTFNKNNYEEITASMNSTFRSTTEIAENDIRRQNKLGINVENCIDFDLLESTLPKGMINSKTFNKRIRELINQLAFVYNLDSIKMSELIRLVIDDTGLINKDKLRETVRKNYEFNNNGSLPVLVYRTQPDHLKTPNGDLSNRGKMIYVFENTKPYDFLKNKNKGVKPTSRDLKLLEHFAVDFDLPPGVINVLVDYSIRKNNGKISPKYMEAIASDWSRKGIKLVPDAMDTASNPRTTKKTVTNVKSTNGIEPEWMYKENKKENLSSEELAELESMFSEFR